MVNYDGFLLAIVAYVFVPESSYDIVRHHEIASKFSEVNSFDGFIETVKGVDLELIPQLYSFLIGKIGDYNLMQAIVVLVGYSFLFYMLIDYRKNVKISNYDFFAIVLLVVFGQHILFYFSGLYNYFAINLFAFAIYIDYYKNKKKVSLLLYVLSFFIHSSMVLPLIIIIMQKIRKDRINNGFVVCFFAILLFIGAILSALSGIIDVEFLNTYNTYVAHNDRMIRLYDGFYLFMSIVKIIIPLIVCYLQRNNIKNRPIMAITLLMGIAVMVLSFSSIAITRFSSLVLFVSFPLLIDEASKKIKSARMLMTIIYPVSVLFLSYSVYTMVPLILGR